MAKLLTVTIPVYRVHKDTWGDITVQRRNPSGRWVKVAGDYRHLTSAKAAMATKVLEHITEAEEANV